jgi:hypothetical protein
MSGLRHIFPDRSSGELVFRYMSKRLGGSEMFADKQVKSHEG